MITNWIMFDLLIVNFYQIIICVVFELIEYYGILVYKHDQKTCH